MEAYEFGKENERKIVLIPGNMMCWKQFEPVVPILAKDFHVIAISTDGYDGTTTFTTVESSAKKLAEYIKTNLGGHIHLVFGESFGCATAFHLFQDATVQVDAMIVSGPQYMSFGPLNGFLQSYIPKNQFNLIKKVHAAQVTKKLPWMLKLFTRTDDEKLLCQFRALAPNISLETLKNCTAEAFRLYGKLETQEPEPNAKVAIWYGGKEPNMKKAVEKITRAYPNAEDHPFTGLGHGEIMTHPERIAEEILRFLD